MKEKKINSYFINFNIVSLMRSCHQVLMNKRKCDDVMMISGSLPACLSTCISGLLFLTLSFTFFILSLHVSRLPNFLSFLSSCFPITLKVDEYRPPCNLSLNISPYLSFTASIQRFPVISLSLYLRPRPFLSACLPFSLFLFPSLCLSLSHPLLSVCLQFCLCLFLFISLSASPFLLEAPHHFL